MPVIEYAGTKHEFPDNFSQEDIAKSLQFWDQKNAKPPAGERPADPILKPDPYAQPGRYNRFASAHPAAARVLNPLQTAAEYTPSPETVASFGVPMAAGESAPFSTLGRAIKSIVTDKESRRMATEILPHGKEANKFLDYIERSKRPKIPDAAPDTQGFHDMMSALKGPKSEAAEIPEPYRPGKLKNVPKGYGPPKPEYGPSRVPASRPKADIPSPDPVPEPYRPGKLKSVPKYGGEAKSPSSASGPARALPRRNTYLEKAREGAAKVEAEAKSQPKVEESSSAGKGSKTEFEGDATSGVPAHYSSHSNPTAAFQLDKRIIAQLKAGKLDPTPANIQAARAALGKQAARPADLPAIVDRVKKTMQVLRQ